MPWALWDFGATAVNAIAITFVFPVYIVGTVGADLPGDISPASWQGWALGFAGLVVALLAPVTGVWVEAPVRRRRVLAALTGMVVLFTAAMSLIRDDHRYFWPALILLACTSACSELATVPYNAMLRQISTPANSGRISGFGLALGYFGSVLMLLMVYLGFQSGTGETRGLLNLSVADGQNVRAAMLLTAAWFALFALPLLISVPRAAPEQSGERVSVLGTYRRLFAEIRGEWRRDRHFVYFLGASALFRDGLAGVFAFAGVIAVSVYGVSQADVLLFGVTASVVAAIGAVAGGHADDWIGPKRVIVLSLSAMITAGLIMVSLSGELAFWVCGLLLALFIGPTLSASRNQMLRMAAHGKEGVAFGLYTTTGRAVSFLAPWMFALFIYLFGTDRAGMAGVCVVLALGLLAMLAVRAPHVRVPKEA